MGFRDFGVMVVWSYGVMVLWCYGVMVLWCFGLEISFKRVFQNRLHLKNQVTLGINTPFNCFPSSVGMARLVVFPFSNLEIGGSNPGGFVDTSLKKFSQTL